MQPDDISPSDLGNGYKLTFQQSPSSGKVRAIVRDVLGETIITGSAVPREEAFRSRLEVLGSEKSNLWMPGSQSSSFDHEPDDEELDPNEPNPYDDPEDLDEANEPDEDDD